MHESQWMIVCLDPAPYAPTDTACLLAILPSHFYLPIVASPAGLERHLTLPAVQGSPYD